MDLPPLRHELWNSDGSHELRRCIVGTSGARDISGRLSWLCIGYLPPSLFMIELKRSLIDSYLLLISTCVYADFLPMHGRVKP